MDQDGKRGFFRLALKTLEEFGIANVVRRIGLGQVPQVFQDVAERCGLHSRMSLWIVLTIL